MRERAREKRPSEGEREINRHLNTSAFAKMPVGVARSEEVVGKESNVRRVEAKVARAVLGASAHIDD